MKKIIFIASIVFLALLFLRFVIGGPEDDWICDKEKGEWVKHGAPSDPMPTEPCLGKPLNCASYNPEKCPAACVVCPPCAACSSISCQTEEFCQDIGFDRSWYKMIQKQIDSFKKCMDAGFPVMESYPRKCRDNLDNLHVENIGNELEKTDIIRLNMPRPNQTINSPLEIEGEARGNWFFEGDFPIVLTDWDGKIIAEGFATAQSESMTEEFVKFKGTLEFEKPSYKDNGTLILRKDNPSGLPENDDALEVPILFNL